MGWRPDLQKEIYNTKEPEARRHGCRQFQEACLEVLPAEYGSLPLGAVPAVDEEPPHRSVLVVPVLGADAGPPLQGVSRVESPTEDLVGSARHGPSGPSFRKDWTGLRLPVQSFS